jgi:Methionine synthase I (cobalamin-dependent), methyltransferase domain
MNDIKNILRKKIMIFDGAMGTMLQSYNLTESDFRGDDFVNHSVDIKGNNDLLCLTKPNVVKEIHKTYLILVQI